MSRDIFLDLIDPDPNQPRKHFDEVGIKELSQSIEANGLAVPILLRRNGSERFTIVHGERRWRAARLLDWQTIPAEVRDITPDEAKWLSLVENVQRNDLSPIEEAQAYKARLDEGLTQTELGQRIGKTQSYVATKLRLLKLPDEVQQAIENGQITEGHAKQLLRLPNTQQQISLSETIIKKGWSVTQTNQDVSAILEIDIVLSDAEKMQLETAEMAIEKSIVETAQSIHEAAKYIREVRTSVIESQFNQIIFDKFEWTPLFGRWVLHLANCTPNSIANHFEWLERFLFGEPRDVAITDLILDHGYYGRTQIDCFVWNDYRDDMRQGDVFPPLLAIEDDGQLLLSDGFHRLYAYRDLGVSTVCVKVEQGSTWEVLDGACRANSRHGKRLKNEDKRRLEAL